MWCVAYSKYVRYKMNVCDDHKSATNGRENHIDMLKVDGHVERREDLQLLRRLTDATAL